MYSEVDRVLDKWGENMVQVARNRLTQGNKDASGRLNASLNYKIVKAYNVKQLQLTGLPYLINVDRGRRAGARRPPIQPIYDWIGYRRLYKANKSYGKKVGNKQQTVTTRKVDGRRSMAYAIATNISKRGIKPFPILNIVTKVTLSARFKSEIAQAQAKDAVNQLKYGTNTLSNLKRLFTKTQ